MNVKQPDTGPRVLSTDVYCDGEGGDRVGDSLFISTYILNGRLHPPERCCYPIKRCWS